MARKKPDPAAAFYQRICKDERGLSPGTAAFEQCTRREAFSINPARNRQLKASTERDKKACAAQGFVEKGSKAERRAFWDCVGDLGDRYVRRVERRAQQRRNRR